MKNLFSREVKKTFYNIGRIGKSNGSKFRILHKPAHQLVQLQDTFYAMHKAVSNWRVAMLTDRLTRRTLLSFKGTPLVPVLFTKNMGIKVTLHEYVRKKYPEENVNANILALRMDTSRGNISLDGRVPLDIVWENGMRRTQESQRLEAARAKISLCETGAILNLFNPGVVGGLPGRHIREIMSAAYGKGAVYKTDIVGFFRNTNKSVVKNALMHACRKQHLVMLAEAMFSRQPSDEFIPIISGFFSEGIALADDFWSDAVQPSGYWPTGECTSLPMPAPATMSELQDILTLQDMRISAYKRTQISSSGISFKSSYGTINSQIDKQHLLGTTLAGQLSIAAFCKKLHSSITFSGYGELVSAKEILARLLNAVAEKRDGMISPDDAMTKIKLPEDLPEAMHVLIKNIVTDILTHYVNSLVIPVTAAMFMFKIRHGNNLGSSGIGMNQSAVLVSHRAVNSYPLLHTAPSRNRNYYKSYRAKRPSNIQNSGGSQMSTFGVFTKSAVVPISPPQVTASPEAAPNIAELPSILDQAFSSGTNHGTVALLLNNECSVMPEDILADGEVYDPAGECLDAESYLDECEDASIPETLVGIPGIRFMSDISNRLTAEKTRLMGEDGSVFAVRQVPSKPSAAIRISTKSASDRLVLVKRQNSFVGLAMCKWEAIPPHKITAALQAGETDDKAMLHGGTLADTVKVTPGFTITNGKSVPQHLLGLDALPGQSYEYRGKTKHTKYVKGNMCVISDSPIRRASLGEYLSHLEWQQLTLSNTTFVNNNFISVAIDKLLPDSIFNADVSRLIIRAGTSLPDGQAADFRKITDAALSKEQAVLLATPRTLRHNKITIAEDDGTLECMANGLRATLLPKGTGDMLLAAAALLESPAVDKLERLAELQAHTNYFLSYGTLVKKAVLGSVPDLDRSAAFRLVDAVHDSQASLEYRYLRYNQVSDYPVDGLPIKAISAHPVQPGDKLAVPCGNNLLVFTLDEAAVATNTINLLEQFLAGNYTSHNFEIPNSDAHERASELLNLACDYSLDYYVTANNALPEGALTSPLLANYVLSEILDDITPEIKALGGEPYAYMDDISVMFENKQPRSTMYAVNKIIGAALAKRGLKINKPKTNMIRGEHKREIFGVCVLKYNGTKNNVSIRLTRTSKRKLRARVHNMEKFLLAYLDWLQTNRSLVPTPEYILQNYPKGFNEQSHLRIPRMLNKLGGSLAWAMAISPGSYTGLRNTFRLNCLLFFRLRVAPLVRECSAGLVDLDVRGKAQLDTIDEYINGGAL